ncbi:MAG: hypothetical protein NTZ20_03040 [Candidatus Levybacteria bacterium]|nr:hypothetical protein [Candidatus Levybacteria bacterium]
MKTSIFADKSTIFIFAFAPAGLGHLRVTNALYEGLPNKIFPLLLGSQDRAITFLHRIMSFHPITRAITQWAEQGLMEDISTFYYNLFLRSHTKQIYEQILTIIDQNIEQPSRVIIIATHFGLAQQIGSIKKKLEKEKEIQIILIVQVTDDSPLHIWFIKEADITFVPSRKTKNSLLKYAKKKTKEEINIEVSPYPISPLLEKNISKEYMEDRISQVDNKNNKTIHVMIPVSGAAVGTDYYAKLIDSLHQKSHRFLFHIISKDAPYVRNFLSQMLKRSYVDITVSSQDKEIVHKYEEIYKEFPISLEITKPSEQSFKALLECTMQGASLLLFSEPIGRQEKDNLNFLRRSNLIPHISVNNLLWEYAGRDKPLVDESGREMLQKAGGWRGFCLPDDPIVASSLINWAMREGILSAMMNCKPHPLSTDYNVEEMQSGGVSLFWKKVENMCNNLSR